MGYGCAMPRSEIEITPQAQRLVWVAIALIVVVVYGVTGYMVLEGWTFGDALFMTVTTMTTVGFREVQPLDASGRVFTLTLIVMGVAVALVGVSLAASLIAEAEIGGSTRRRRMRRKIEDLRDHFIVCAYGRVGRAAVRELQDSGLPFVVLDPKDELRTRMEEDEIPFIVDDPSLEPVLRAAGVDRARGLICAVDSDATNVYITLTARSSNPDLFIVARASEPGTAEQLERAGANRVVSPFISSGRHMVRMARDPSIIDIFDEGSRGRNAIAVEERRVDPGSDLDGRTVVDVGSPVLALRRGTESIPAPDGEVQLSPGDVVLLLRDERP
jgi:voltage-gated potassium channel